MKRTVALLLACLVGACQPHTAFAAQAPLAKRPTVALVLSGGGARGGAHVGVLKVMEALRVPVDIVVGTSAGAIVGAAYASGMPIADIEREMHALNTASLFHDVNRQVSSIDRKDEIDSGLIGPEIGVGAQGVSLPRGAIAGIALEGVLRRLTSRQPSGSFDDLPIRFRAVATDAATGEMVVLGKGSLAQAVRASMAVPAVISPVEIDGRLLVDGGMSRNLPVDIARELGADVIIAVNIGTPLLRRDELRSVLSMSDQVMRMLAAANLRVSLKELRAGDVLITPQLGELRAANFDQLERAIAVGEQAGNAAAGKLSALALAPADYAAWLARSVNAGPACCDVVSEVRIEGASHVSEPALLAMMETREGGRVDPATVERDMRRLYARGDFEHVAYTFDDLPAGGKRMTATLAEKSWGPHFLRFGLGLSTDFEGNSFFSLRASHRRTWLNDLGAQWRNSLEIGHSDRLRTEWLQPLTATQRFFASAYAHGARTPLDIYADGERLARYRRQSAGIGVDLGMELAQWGEIRFGIERGQVKLLNDTSFIPASLLRAPQQTGSLMLRLRADTLDHPSFPRSGVQANLLLTRSRKALGADENFDKANFSGKSAVSDGPHSVVAAVEIQRAIGRAPLPATELIASGGFLRMSGLRTGELLGSELGFARLTYNYRLSDSGLLDGVYLGVSAELGRVSGTIDLPEGSRTVRSNALYMAFGTPLGPLYLGAGRTGGGQQALYLLIGNNP